MAADLHLHIATEDMIKEVEQYYLTDWYSSEGNAESDGATRADVLVDGEWIPWRDWNGEGEMKSIREIPLEFNHYKLMTTPNVWVGEVSWLKAGLSGDKKAFIPDLVESVSDIVGQTTPPEITDEFIAKIRECFINSAKHSHYSTSDEPEVVQFLEAHKGQYVYQVSH